MEKEKTEIIKRDFINFISEEIENQASEGFITSSESRVFARIDYVFVDEHYPVFIDLYIGQTDFKVSLDSRINAVAYASAAKLLARLWGFEKEYRNDEGTITFSAKYEISEYDKDNISMECIIERLKYAFTQSVEDMKDLLLYDSRHFLEKMCVFMSYKKTHTAKLVNKILAEKVKGLLAYQRSKED